MNPLISREVDVAIINGLILTIDKQMRIIERGYVFIKKGKIIELGSMKNLYASGQPKIKAKEEINAKGSIVLPGFVNTHNHFAMTLLRGIANDMPLQKWLNDYIWPIEAELKPKDCYIGSQLAALEMIQGGTTTACDMYFFEEQTVDAFEAIGFRGVLGYGMLDFGNEEKRAEELEATKKLIAYTNQHANLCVPIVSPHAPNTCSEELLVKSKKLAQEHQLPLQIHLAETKAEIEEFQEKKGQSPTSYLNEMGFLGKELVAAHCIWLDEQDCKMLGKHNVKIANNPSSNLKLGSGIMDYQRLNKHGITIAIGTDGAASNNNLSMIEELRLASYLAKGTNTNPSILPASQIIKMATLNGAKALGLEDKIGSLERGKQADIIILNYQKPYTWPPHDPYALIAYAAQDANISTTIINGKIVMHKRQFTTIDPTKVMQEARETTIDLLERTNSEQFQEKLQFLQEK